MLTMMELTDPRCLVIKETSYFALLSRVKNLVECQRKALRTGSKKKIEECKVRERALLDYCGQYEAYRAKMYQALNMEIEQ